MNCDCNCNKNGNVWLVIQQGDTFALQFEYEEGDEPVLIPEGYDLLCGIYDISTDELIQSARLSDGTLRHLVNGTYQMNVTHESSMKMIGNVLIELTLFSEDKTVVDHASDIVYMKFTRRRNNDII